MTASTRKRTASATAASIAVAKRSKTQKATPTKSQYFNESEGNDADEGLLDREDGGHSSAEDEASDFADSREQSSLSEAEEKSNFESEEAQKACKGPMPKKAVASTTAIRTKGDELWRAGVKAGLGPGTQVVVKKPKARPAGKTPYSHDTIHANTFLFLTDLKANNDREWLKMHDADYRASERDWHSFVDKLTERLTSIDDTIPELPVKDLVFRIYRDVRFSTDPTPYKPYFSAAWSRTGRKGPYAHYYIQVSPNNESFIGGGLWNPEAAQTAAIRRDIDANPRRMKDILLGEHLRKAFLAGSPKNDGKVVKAFVEMNSVNALKTRPKGYDADHADIELMRLRNFAIRRRLNDDELVGEGGLDTVAELFACMKPFITYLNLIVMPDEVSSSDDEEGDSAEQSSEGGGNESA